MEKSTCGDKPSSHWTLILRAQGDGAKVLPAFAASALRQVEALRDEALNMAAYAASGQASTVLYQLREYAEVLDRAARDPQVLALVDPESNVPVAPPGENPCASHTQLLSNAALLPYSAGAARAPIVRRSVSGRSLARSLRAGWWHRLRRARANQ